ncbi:MAG: transglycosylase domain-containing protein [Patescibacteria group bacterium]|jgi:1A family penicillin-binding protein
MTFPHDIKSSKDFNRPRRIFPRLHRRLALHRLSYSGHQRRNQIRVLFNYLGSLAILAAIFGFIFFLIIFIWTTSSLPTPDKLLERKVEQTTTIYDRKGENILYQLHGDTNRKIIQLTDLPAYVKWAAIAAEDHDFYNHSGFSIRGIARSFFSNFFYGTKVGGSTITQQFVKNAILTTEKSYVRKLKELILAYRIEQKFTKDEILQMYFNEIPYGSVIYGVEAASEAYFGKPAKDLTLAQAAVLAAMTQRPTYFSPYGSNVDQLLERQRYVLNQMVDLGYATEKDAAAAKAEKIEFVPRRDAMLAPHFVMYIRELLADQFGERYAEEAGLKVTTTIDINYQELAEKAVADHWENNRTRYNGNNAALVSLDTKTGQILALVGSADFNNEDIDGQVNVALRPRQPGSSFKPLAYVTAFNKGYTPETVLFDVETTFKTDTKDYAPKNYDTKEHGPVTMRQALAGSLNIPAVKTLYLAGVSNVLDLAEKLGYTTLHDRSRFGLSLVLGGGEVKLLEHTAGYAAFAREGVYHAPVAILKIEDADGKTLYEYKPEENQGTEVLPAEPVRSLTSILSDNAARAYIFGEKNYLTLPDRPVAAKTGTTNDYHDAWTLGYTPSVATGVWVGNSDNEAMNRGADGSVVAAPIWNEYMRAITAGQPVEAFNAPAANDANKPVLQGVIPAARTTRIDKTNGLEANSSTPAENIVERKVANFHCILYYLNKDDPRGPAPADPFSDPQYAGWEDAVQTWAKKQGYAIGSEPLPIDNNPPANQNAPTIEILYPTNGQTITGRSFSTSVAVSAPSGIRRVEYYLDNQPIGTIMSAPWDLNGNVPELTSGIHTLTAKVFDNTETSASKSVDLNFLIN